MSQDDWDELDVVIDSLLHAQRHNITTSLGVIVQRLRHIKLRTDGVKE